MGTVIALVLSISLALLCNSSGPGTAATHGSAGATLHFVAVKPVKLQGRHFHDGERLRLTLRAGAKTAHRTIVTTSGTFVATFPAIVIDRCTTGAVALARRANGSVIGTKLPLLGCLPERSGGLTGRSP